MRLLSFSLLLILSAGCLGSTTQVAMDATTTSKFTFVWMGRYPDRGYLVDPVSETCTLIYELSPGEESKVAIPVDCAKVAAKEAAVAAAVTWLPRAEPAAAAAPTQP